MSPLPSTASVFSATGFGPPLSAGARRSALLRHGGALDAARPPRATRSAVLGCLRRAAPRGEP
eukprot:9040130-Alexandrium_andersonii.AAC.1